MDEINHFKTSFFFTFKMCVDGSSREIVEEDTGRETERERTRGRQCVTDI